MVGRRSPSPRRVPGAAALTMLSPRAASPLPAAGDGPAPLSRAAKRRLRDKARRLRFAADPAREPGPPVMDAARRGRSPLRRNRNLEGPAPRRSPSPITDRADGRRVAVTDQAEVRNIDQQTPGSGRTEGRPASGDGKGKAKREGKNKKGKGRGKKK